MANDSDAVSFPSASLGPRKSVGRSRSGPFNGLRRDETISGYLFLLPNFIGFVVFSLFPILAAFVLTLTDWNMVKAPQFVAATNYVQAVNDPLFWQTAWNSIYYTVGAVPIGIFIAFCLALILNRPMRGVIFFRTVFFLPQVTLTVAIAIVWAWIYNPQVGLLNYLLSLIGVSGPNWLGSTVWAMPAIIIMGNWKGIGGAMLIFLAGLQGIPEEFYEAAKIDGANWFNRIRFITIPLISPVTFFVLVTSLIGAMQGFDQFYVMTNGGPAFATTTIVMYIYNNGFSYFRMGYAATLAAILFLVIFVVTMVQWRLAKSWVYGFEV